MDGRSGMTNLYCVCELGERKKERNLKLMIEKKLLFLVFVTFAKKINFKKFITILPL